MCSFIQSFIHWFLLHLVFFSAFFPILRCSSLAARLPRFQNITTTLSAPLHYTPPPTSASLNKPHRLLSTQVSTTTCAPAGTTASSTRSAGKTARRAVYASVSRPGWTWEVSGVETSRQRRANHVQHTWLALDSARAGRRESVDGEMDGEEKREK